MTLEQDALAFISKYKDVFTMIMAVGAFIISLIALVRGKSNDAALKAVECVSARSNLLVSYSDLIRRYREQQKKIRDGLSILEDIPKGIDKRVLDSIKAFKTQFGSELVDIDEHICLIKTHKDFLMSQNINSKLSKSISVDLLDIFSKREVYVEDESANVEDLILRLESNMEIIEKLMGTLRNELQKVT